MKSDVNIWRYAGYYYPIQAAPRKLWPRVAASSPVHVFWHPAQSRRRAADTQQMKWSLFDMVSWSERLTAHFVRSMAPRCRLWRMARSRAVTFIVPEGLHN